MGKIGITETFCKSDPANQTFFQVAIENRDGCCASVKISQGENCRIGASNIQAIVLTASECKALAHLLLVAAGELDSQNKE